MSSIKLSPLILFLILIAVLVMSYIFGYKTEEGFVSYQYNTTNSMPSVVIPFYSKDTVTQLYDNLYFDNKNGNLIDVNSTNYNGNIDLTGNTITSISVTPREGVTTSIYTTQINGTVILPQTVDLSLRKPVASSYTSWIYKNTCPNTDSYSAVYIPFDDNTYVHLLNSSPSAPTQIGTYLFGAGNAGNFNKPWINTSSSPLTGLTSAIQDNDPNNNKMINEAMYSSTHQLYQIGKYVKYDLSNANLIIQQGDGTTKILSIYDRYNNKTTTSSGMAPAAVTGVSSVANVNAFNPYTIIDLCGQNLVVYMSIAKKTVIALIKYNTSTKSFSLGNVCRFDDVNIIKGPSASQPTGNNPPPTDSSASEYYKWYWYWKTGSANNGPTNLSSDYMLKTQIVPPVCPACPACNSNSTCTNCGGQGGSGTLSNHGGSMVNGSNTNAGGAISNVSQDVGDTVSNVAGGFEKTVQTGILTGGALVAGAGIEAGVLAEDAGSGAASLARDAASGTAGFVKDAASGTAGFVKDVASGTVGLAKDTVSGAVDLVKDTGSAIADLGKDGEGSSGDAIQTQESSGKGRRGGPLGTQNQYNDQYSYYGTLPAKKSSEFMPITADFSKFGK